VRKVGNFHIFAATVTREGAQRRLVDELLAMLGGRSRPVVAHLIDAGKLTLEDVEFAEKKLKELRRERLHDDEISFIALAGGAGSKDFDGVERPSQN
jgi:hypothetical protein